MGVEVAVAAAVVAAGTSVYAGEEQAKQQRKAGRRQAAAMRAEAAAERERGRRLRAAQTAAYGAAGVQTGSGTPLMVIGQAAMDNIRQRERLLAGARNALLDARAQASASRLQGYGQAIGYLGQAASISSAGATPTQDTT